MARRPEPSETERQALLRDLTEVGPTKPVGYLPLYTIREFVQLTPEAVAATATAHGLATAQFGPAACCIKSGALYFYDREALADLLQEAQTQSPPLASRQTQIALWLTSLPFGSILPIRHIPSSHAHSARAPDTKHHSRTPWHSPDACYFPPFNAMQLPRRDSYVRVRRSLTGGVPLCMARKSF